jgi:sporadic carbohydrate cluster 2OG-Fe(II) oxygenase
MSLPQTFDDSLTSALVNEFLESGYVVRDVEDRALLDELRHEIVLVACRHMNTSPPGEDGVFLDHLHEIVRVEDLNAFRLAVYGTLNDQPWFRPAYYRLGRRTIETLVGNELAMQNRINVSIQMPHDRTSLLDIHADVFSGETPYQVVQWVPLVDVQRTKSIFILPRSKSEAVTAKLSELGTRGMQALYESVKTDLRELEISYGQVLVFCPNFLHGNVVNHEPTTRWSLNCRITGLFTPYVSPEKSLGSFYLPITPRPVTRLGMAHKQPSGFSE